MNDHPFMYSEEMLRKLVSDAKAAAVGTVVSLRGDHMLPDQEATIVDMAYNWHDRCFHALISVREYLDDDHYHCHWRSLRHLSFPRPGQYGDGQ